MQNSTAWLLFAVFGVILFVMYVAIRRRWGSPVLVAVVGVAASIVVMTLTGLSQRNTIYQAIFAGLLVGSLFSLGTLAIASYFLANEQRRKAAQQQGTENRSGEVESGS